MSDIVPPKMLMIDGEDEILKHWESPVHTAAMRWGM